MRTKNFKKVLLVSILSFVTLFSAIIGISNLNGKTVSVQAAVISDETRAESGLSFTATELYKIDESLTAMPKTVEAYVKLSGTARQYSIISSFQKTWKSTEMSYSVEVNANGVPRLYYWLGKENNIVFNNAKLPTDGKTWAHLVITNDGTTAECWINGELEDTVTKNAKSVALNTFNYDVKNTAGTVIGYDNSNDATRVFLGNVKSVECYSDVRTADEIKADYQRLLSAAPVDNNLLCAYNFTQSGSAYLKDLSQNGYDIDFTGDEGYNYDWITYKEEPTDYAYSFAVVGDTQCVNELNPEHMNTIYDWIIANKDNKKISHVFGLGDITQSGDATKSATEWDNAVSAISKLDGVIPHSLIRGNHDDSVLFNEHFNYDAYTGQFNGFYKADRIDSAYKTFTAGTTDYLLITLDYGADDAELNWASTVIDSFPNHKVIITTHAYLYRDGTPISINDVCSPSDSSDWTVDPYKVYNNGDQMWDKLISKHGNIFLVLSGHDPCEDVITTQSKGIHGNTVTQMLIDPQGMDSSIGTYPESTGMVCMLYFSEDGSKIDVEWYSTIKQAYYKAENQYSINIADQTVNSHNITSYEYDEEMHWGICSDCGKKVQGSHEYGEWQVVTEATGTVAGVLEKSCVCGHTVTKVETNYDFGNAFGASLRVSEPMGIRFRLQIKDKNAIFDGTGTKQLGMFVFPAEWLADANGDYASINPKIDIKFTESDVYKDGESYYANGVISNMYLQNTIIDFIGVGYIATTENDVTTYDYSTFEVANNSRSVLDVAISAYKDVNATVSKATLVNIIEKAIYAKYGVVENRENGVTTFSYNGTNYSSYEEMKLANPITLALNINSVVGIGESFELKTLVKVNGTTVDIALPISYEYSNGIKVVGNEIVVKEAGIHNVTATFGEYVVSKDFEAYKVQDGILLDGVRDEMYGDFMDKVILNDGRWYTISAVKTENGVFIYTQALFNTTVIGDPGTAIHSVWNNSTNFEFKLGGAIKTDNYSNQYYVNIAGQNKGVDAFTFDVEEVNGKYLHTFEMFVSKALIEKWSDTEDLQLNYAWMSPDEQASIYSDMIDYQYLSSWGNNSTFHAYHRLGGTTTGFNDMVANLFISENGLVANECDIATMDGVIDTNESLMLGANELNKSTTNTTTNVKATIVDGDIYMAITVTHNAWSTYNTAWHLNDNFEMRIGDDNVVIMFLNGVPCIPAYFDSYGITTTEVSGKLVTVLELYKKGVKGAYNFRINANGANFGWNDILWNTTPNTGTISENGISFATSGNVVVEGVLIDGKFDDSVYTSVIRDYSFTTDANGATVTVMGVKLEQGLILATSILTTKDANTTVDGSTATYKYTNPEFNFGNKSSGFITTKNGLPANNTALVARCYSVDNGNGTYTHNFEYYVSYADIGVDGSGDIPFSIGGWFETGWKWIDGGNSTIMTHTLTNYGIKEMWEKMSTAEFLTQPATFGSTTWNTTKRARVAFAVKMMAGTKFTFVGDNDLYDWAINECSDNSTNNSTGVIYDSGYITGTTYTTKNDSYPVIVLKKDDGTAFTTTELENLNAMFVVDGYKLSPTTSDNAGAITQEEFNSQFVRFANAYNGLSNSALATNRASIVVSFKVAKGTKITYSGSTSYNWAVVEKYTDGTTASDSGWNNATTFKGTSSTEYVVLKDGNIWISLKKASGNFTTTENLSDLISMFTIEGTKIAPSVTAITSTINSIAHRGYSTTAPENTLSAYRVAAQNGFSMVECDVQFTSDGVPVLLHDDTIDRTSNGSGKIAEMTLAKARSYEYGGWKSSAYYGEQIPTFSEFIDLCKELGLHPYIEIKGELSAEYAKVLVDIVTEKGMLDNVSWISFGSAGLSEIVKLDDTARVGYVVNNVTADVITTAKTLQTGNNQVFINNWYNCDANEITLCKDANLALEVWYIDDVSKILALDEYISGVTSNWLVAGTYIG